MLDKKTMGRPLKKSARKINILISCFPEHKVIIKELVKKLNEDRNFKIIRG